MSKAEEQEAAEAAAVETEQTEELTRLVNALSELGGMATTEQLRAKLEEDGDKLTAAQADKALGKAEEQNLVWRRKQGEDVQYLLTSTYKVDESRIS